MMFAATACARLGLNGLWHYLVVRAELRTALEKERERNRAFAAHREGLRGDRDTALVDYEDQEGRKLWISRSSTGGGQAAILRLSAESMDSAQTLPGRGSGPEVKLDR
jgi:hypothetical protein